MNKNVDGLLEKLSIYNKDNVLPMHMPGHKRKEEYSFIPGLYSLDITEIHGFDNLHEPNDILKKCKEEASQLFHSEQSYYLVNGSTSGILAGIRACTTYGDKVIVSRNSHKSVYHGIEINGLESVYLYPSVDETYDINNSISVEQVRKTIEQHKDAKLLIITSPSYDGIISDVKSICEIAHEHNIPVMVDEAHGSHMGFHKELYKNSNELGADLVIHSLHKTLPAMTQCAMLHKNGTRVNEKRLEKELAIFQTSSPSYILMASIEQCINLLSKQKDRLFQNYVDNLKEFSQRLIGLKYLKVYGKGIEPKSHPKVYGHDIGKILISTVHTNLTGRRLMSILRESYNIELEMSNTNYVLAMTSICDGKEAFTRLAEAILDIDSKIELNYYVESSSATESNIESVSNQSQNAMENENCKDRKGKQRNTTHPVDKSYCTISQAVTYDRNLKDMEELEGNVSAEYIWAYPPGIPLIVPGEIITKELLQYFNYLMEKDVDLHSTDGLFPIKLHTLTFNAKNK